MNFQTIKKFGNIAIKSCFSSVCAGLLLAIGSGCSVAQQEKQQESIKCESYKTYASISFEVQGDMSELVEKTAKKALTKSCFKKSDQSKNNMRIRIQSTQSLHTESGFIKDKHDNSFSLDIVAIMLMSTQQGGQTTITSKQNAKLNLKSTPIADFGSKSELSEKELIPFIDNYVLVALDNLYKEIP